MNQQDRDELEQIARGKTYERLISIAVIALIAFVAQPLGDIVFGSDARTTEAITEVRQDIKENNDRTAATLDSVNKAVSELNKHITTLQVTQGHIKAGYERDVGILSSAVEGLSGRVRDIEGNRWRETDHVRAIEPIKKKIDTKAEVRDLRRLQRQVEWLLRNSGSQEQAPPAPDLND